jgi:3-oxoacid CoA-transferase
MRASRLFASRALCSRREFSSSTARRAINKVCSSASEAIKDMKGGTTVLVGGFGFSGVPNSLINALRDRPDLKDFTVVSNNAGMRGVGLGECEKEQDMYQKG